MSSPQSKRMTNRMLPIYDCPFCRRQGFTSNGIRHHRCPKNPLIKPMQITAEQWLSIINSQPTKPRRRRAPKP